LSDKLIFLGTAGGRASVFRYLRRSGGFLLRLSNLWVHTDPGPGAFVYLHQMGFDPRQINCVVLSHIHLDHSADINSVIESATDGGKKREVVLFAPRSALEGENRVVLPFIRKERLAGEFILEEGKEYNYKGLRIKAIMKHKHHHTETYAILYNERILYVSCALYEDRMLEVYPKGTGSNDHKHHPLQKNQVYRAPYSPRRKKAVSPPKTKACHTHPLRL
jgi:ribonuclease BN (tRNA processing enzyme)